MTDYDLMTVADVQLMQGLAQRVTAIRPDWISAGASYGELAWIWGKDHATQGDTWPRRLWFDGDELAAWAWAFLPHRIQRNDGSVTDVTTALLTYQVHPDHVELIDDVIDWYDEVAAGLERAALPTNFEEFALARWAAHGYRVDEEALSDTGDWTQLNERDLDEIEQPLLPPGFRFRTAVEVGPEALVRAHTAAWERSSYTAASYEGVRSAPGYRADLHVLVEAPDGTMAASTIMWFDPANQSIEFEPVGTHRDFRRRGLSRAMMLRGMHLAREAGAVHATVVCHSAPNRPAPKALYYGLGFRELSRDAPRIKGAAEH